VKASWLLPYAACWSLACGATVDPLGHDPAGASGPPAPDSDTLRALRGPAVYDSPFQELLGKTEQEVDAKLSGAFQRLFHGDIATQAIYFTVGDDQAYVQDILHGDVRSEGVGLGMLIALELDQRDELDRLWTYAAAALRYQTGPRRGYFRSSCADGPCVDPYGQQTLAMALLFAHGRWGSHSGHIDYGSEALQLLDVMWHKQQQNGGIVDGVTNLFDADSSLAVDEPTRERAAATRPANVMPGYYALWAQATGDGRWLSAASAGRRFLQAAAHATTGLLPWRASFQGQPLPGSDTFVSDVYRAQLNMTLDHVFHGEEPWYTAESDKLLAFFASQGLASYGSTFPLDGSGCIDCLHALSLVAMNGVSALPATSADKSAFVEAVWNAVPTDGPQRYYDDLLHLLALLTLGGRLRVY
jgi:oligosaccharide reducing-end xylanase